MTMSVPDEGYFRNVPSAQCINLDIYRNVPSAQCTKLDIYIVISVTCILLTLPAKCFY